MLLNRYTVIVVSTGQWIESQRKVGHVRFSETGGGWRIERVAIRKDFMGLMPYLNRPWSGHNFKGQNAGQGVRAGGKHEHCLGNMKSLRQVEEEMRELWDGSLRAIQSNANVQTIILCKLVARGKLVKISEKLTINTSLW